MAEGKLSGPPPLLAPVHERMEKRTQPRSPTSLPRSRSRSRSPSLDPSLLLFLPRSYRFADDNVSLLRWIDSTSRET